jgi:hypothetical protein
LGRLRVRLAGPERLHVAAIHAVDDGAEHAGGQARPPARAVAFEPGPAGIPIDPCPELRGGAFARLAAGRRAHVGSFSSRCCGALAVGDLSVHWMDATVPVDGLETALLGETDGVPVSADRVLLPVLAAGGPTLVLASLAEGRHLAVRLARPEAWIDLLDGGPA